MDFHLVLSKTDCFLKERGERWPKVPLFREMREGYFRSAAILTRWNFRTNFSRCSGSMGTSVSM